MNTKFHKLTLAVMVAFIINPLIYAKEVSFTSGQLLSDQAASTGSSFFGNIESADIDGDGDEDIVITQYGSDDEISWLENDGGDFIDFPQHIISTSVSALEKIQLVDLDQDGDFDIVGVDDLADELLWFENDGTGTSWTTNIIQDGATAEGASDFGVADIDADGDLDIVLAAGNTTVLYWYENTGNAMTWTQHDTGVIPAGDISSLVVGDFDLDGTIDIVYGTKSGTPFLKLVGNVNGDGSSWAVSTVATGSSATIVDIRAQDIDLDGFTEIYYHESNGDLNQLTYDSSSFSWISSSIIPSGVHGKTSFIDIDKDGDLDLMAGSSNDLSWFENTDGVGGSWTERVLIASLAEKITSLHALDLDKDGDLEIVVAKNEDGFVYAYENLLFHSMPQYDTASVIDSSHTSAYHVVTGKLNGDQYPDIVSANKSSSGMEIFFYAGDGNGNYSLTETILDVSSTTDDSISAIALGDIDNDGDLDIVFAADGSDSIYIIENQMDAGPFSALKPSDSESLLGANWSSETNIASGVGRSAEIQVTDINADGNIDIVYLAQVNNTVKWLDNDGAWTVMDIGSVSNQTSLKVGDLNGDGYVDVITGGNSNGGSRLWTNDTGDGLTWSETIVGSGHVPRQIAIADLDNDGDLDVVHGRSSSENIEWVENNGDGTTWTRHDTMISTGFTPYEIDVVDYDGNGQLDILLQDTNGDLSLVKTSDISTDSWSLSTLISGLDSPRSFTTFDYDFDGDLDIVSKGSSSGEIVTIENIGGQYAVTYTNAAAQNQEDSQTIDVVSFTTTHNGELSDGDMQLSSLHLGFQPGTGCANTPMQSTDLNPLVAAIAVYADDGSGVFELFSDALIYTEVGPFTLVNGQITLSLPDQHSDLQIAPQASKDYFVTLKIRTNASSQACHGLIPYFFVGFNLGVSDTLRAQDRDSGLELNGAYTEFSLPNEQLIIASTNTTPTTTGIMDQNGTEASAFNLDISGDFNDADGDVLFYTALGLPLTLSINGLTGIISGTPSNQDAINSPFSVNIIAKDPQGATVNSLFDLDIADVNVAPTVSNPRGDFSLTQGEVFNTSVMANFNDSDGDMLSYSATGLPAGLNIMSNGNFIGMITNTDWLNGPMYNVSVRATDPDGEFVEDSFVITIINVNDAPLFIGPIMLQNGMFDVAFAFDTSTFFVDPDGDTMTYSADVLPDGLSISSDGNITGTPTAVAFTQSPYAVTITVMDPLGESISSNQFVFTITDATNDVIFANGME